MIGQYLSNTNENALIPILQNFLQLNKAIYENKNELHSLVEIDETNLLTLVSP